MKQALRALCAAIRNPRRVLACIRACDGVQLDVIELHDHDYNLQHLHDHIRAAGAVRDHAERRLQDVTAERDRLHAALQSTSPTQQPLAWDEWRRQLAEKVDNYIQLQSEGEGDDEAYEDLKAHILRTPFATPAALRPAVLGVDAGEGF